MPTDPLFEVLAVPNGGLDFDKTNWVGKYDARSGECECAVPERYYANGIREFGEDRLSEEGFTRN